MFHIPFLMVFYHVKTIIVPIGICVSTFICAGVINRVIAHSCVCLHMHVCMFVCTLKPLQLTCGCSFSPSVCRAASRVLLCLWKDILTQFVALALFLFLLHSLSLSTCRGIVSLHGWRNRRTQTELNATRIIEQHYQPLPAHHWLLLCVWLTRRSNKSTCLSTASSFSFAWTYSFTALPPSTHLCAPLSIFLLNVL